RKLTEPSLLILRHRTRCPLCPRTSLHDDASPRLRHGKFVSREYAVRTGLPAHSWAAHGREPIALPIRGDENQKQRTWASACARPRSLVAVLACSGSRNMVPKRPGTWERLKNVSAAT